MNMGFNENNSVVSSKGSTRSRRSGDEIRKIIDDYRQSGLSQRKFCKLKEVSLATLCSWLRKDRSKLVTSLPGNLNRGVPTVSFEPMKNVANTIELELPNKSILRIPPDFDENALRRLIIALESAHRAAKVSRETRDLA